MRGGFQVKIFQYGHELVSFTPVQARKTLAVYELCM